MWLNEYKCSKRGERNQAIHTWRGDYYDKEDSAPRVRPAHCTSSGLTPATTSNRRGSGAKFLIVGLSVRADPVFLTEIRNYIISFSLDSKDLCVCK